MLYIVKKYTPHIIIAFATIISGVMFSPDSLTALDNIQNPQKEEEVGVSCSTDMAIKEYAECKVNETFGEQHWESFQTLVKYEVCGKKNGGIPVNCDWTKRNTAQNPSSTAYGIGQFLDSTWKLVGCKKTSDPYTQVNCMVDYIDRASGNFKNPSQAVKFHKLNNWY